nr:g-type lectin s-receptor-like serine/threonine-protein kinase lecrk2 [Quercus suber]
MALQPSYLLSLLLLVLLLPYSTTAQTSSNLSLGLSLIAQENGSYWASPSGDFAFGFQQIGNGGYLLAIWFNKIPEKTIVWSANGDNLVPTGSKVEITKDGQLVLSDPTPTGTEIWQSESGGLGVVYAAMLDTGNLVLASQDGSHLWQSFDHPTDTILPTQTMSMGSKLVAHYSETNYSNGRFQFALQKDGNLVLQTLAFPTDWSDTVYWPIGSGFQVVFNESGYIYLTATNGSILTTVSSNSVSKQDFYQRAVMEYDGVLIHYVYPKSSTNTSNAWSILSVKPPNICEITEDIGSGACGFNSYCELGGDGRPNCKCPTRYTLIDPNDVMKGCREDFLPQSCYEASSKTDQFDLSEMESINWPLSDYGRYVNVTEDWCRNACLGDCFCAVAVFGGGQCWKKKIPLSNGIKDPDNAASKVLIKIRKDNSTSNPSGADLKKKNHSTVILIVSVLLSSSMFLNLLFLMAAFLPIFRFKYWKSKAIKTYPFMPGMNLQSYTYEELTKATNGFREELGRGAFAKVYKGVLEDEDRKLVAVKRMNDLVKEGDMEFKAESFEAKAKDEDHMVLADWAYDCYKDKKLDLLVENDVEATDDMKRLEKYVMIAIWCIQEDPSLRPTMKKVVQMIEGSIEDIFRQAFLDEIWLDFTRSKLPSYTFVKLPFDEIAYKDDLGI